MPTKSDSQRPGPPRTPEMWQELLGTVIEDEWRVEGLLGVGGMAVVLAASSISSGAAVAIKVLRPEFLKNEEVRARFQSEFLISQRIDHPGVVTMMETGTLASGEPFLVMERLSGQSLEELANELGTLSVERALAIADATLEALAAAHARGIIHRDIKPENLFLMADGTVKLIDFGIAGADDLSKDYVTRIGYTMGTSAFMPPEQARGRWSEVDSRADLFALAATLYLLLSGHTIHPPLAGEELLLAATQHSARPIREVAPELPECVEKILGRALAFAPADRYPSARHMQAEVRRAKAWLGARGDAPAEVPRALEPTRPVSNLLSKIPGTAVVLGISVAVLWASPKVVGPLGCLAQSATRFASPFLTDTAEWLGALGARWRSGRRAP